MSRRRASARRVAMARRCSPTTTVTGARKCPAARRAASTTSHSASNAGAPYGVHPDRSSHARNCRDTL